MKVSARTEEWLAVVSVCGELDAETAPQLRAELNGCLDRGARWVLVDMAGLDYIDSVGVGLLIGAARRVAEVGGELAVVCTTPAVCRVFAISGTGDLLNLRPAEAAGRQVLEEHHRAHGADTTPPGGENDV